MRPVLSNRDVRRSFYLSRLSQLAILLVGLLFSVSANAQVDFVFDFKDSSGVGFNHNSRGAERRAGLESAALVVESLFKNYNATIRLDVTSGASGFLASAGSNYSGGYPGPGFVDQGDVMRKILGGDSADPDPNGADGEVEWNFQDVFWEYGDDYQPGEYDFISTGVHELLHTVGFLSGLEVDGTDYWDSEIDEPGTWEAFDKFVFGPSGPIINPTTFVTDVASWNSARVGGTDDAGLFFAGINATGETGGKPINLYSPSDWEEGSSGSHLDDEFYDGTYIMESASDEGPGIQKVTRLERAMLRDIGYESINYGLFADLNYDDAVDSSDLGLLLNNFAKDSELRYESGNLNLDAAVDSTDLGLLLNQFGAVTSANTVAVPEPEGWVLLVLATVGFAFRRR